MWNNFITNKLGNFVNKSFWAPTRAGAVLKNGTTGIHGNFLFLDPQMAQIFCTTEAHGKTRKKKDANLWKSVDIALCSHFGFAIIIFGTIAPKPAQHKALQDNLLIKKILIKRLFIFYPYIITFLKKYRFHFLYKFISLFILNGKVFFRFPV